MWLKEETWAMQKVYDKKNIWTHEGPSTKKKKNDEHMNAQRRKKDSHVSK